MPNPLVSTVIPVYQGERFIERALASVFAQEYGPLEVIVVDDGSSDGGAALAAAHAGVRCLRQPNHGVPVARNAGIAATRGEFIAFLDQDDAWLPGKLHAQMRRMRERPELRYVVARQRMALAPGAQVPAWLRRGLLDEDQSGFLPSTLLARRSAFDEVGPFDPGLSTVSDLDWFVRARDMGVPMEMLPEVLVQRWVHDSNHSSQVRNHRAELLRVLHRSLRRRGEVRAPR